MSRKFLSGIDVTGNLTASGNVTGTWAGNFSSPTGFRNVLHNGSFAVWQRGTSVTIPPSVSISGITGASPSTGFFTATTSATHNIPVGTIFNIVGTNSFTGTWPSSSVTTNTLVVPSYVTGTFTNGTVYPSQYAADRWRVYSTASATVSAVIQSTKEIGMTVNSGTTNHDIVQRIEAASSYHLAGNTITISGTITGSASLSVSLYYNSSTTDDSWDVYGTTRTNRTQIGSTYSIPATNITNGTRWSTQFTVPGAATYGLELVISATSVTGTVTYKEIQLELGSVATPFERRPYAIELAECQRFFEVLGGTGNTCYIGAAGYNAATSAGVFCPLVTTKRATPVAGVTYSALTDYSYLGPNGGTGGVAFTSIVNCSSTSFLSSSALTSPSSAVLKLNHGTTAYTAGSAYTFRSNGTYGVHVSAEL